MANKYGEAALIAAPRLRRLRQKPQRSVGATPCRRSTAPAPLRKSRARKAPSSASVKRDSLPASCPASTTKSKDNKRYAVDAVALLRAGSCPATVTALWSQVAEPGKTHNSQMDVVLALWKNNLIAK